MTAPYYRELDRPGREVFELLLFAWDVSKAQRLLNQSGREPDRQLEVSYYQRNREIIRGLKLEVALEERIDLSVPLIAVSLPQYDTFCVIDGWHRLMKADHVLPSSATLPCFVLTRNEMLECMVSGRSILEASTESK